MATLTDRLAHAWNVFKGNENIFNNSYPSIGSGLSYRPDKYIVTPGLERTIVNAIITRIAIDCSQVPMFEARLDENRNVKERIKGGLTECLTVEANIDQTGRAFMLDLIISMLDEGIVAVVPVDTTIDPKKSESYQIESMRVGRITDWYPEHVRINLYNEKTGLKEQVLVPKKMVAICENPLYSVMNRPNSTLKRLVRKLNLLDYIDDQTGSGKLDMIIQLPYVIKSESRRREAERRRKDIENQLANSKYGVAYTDGTEKITQLNRPLENNLQSQINDLTSMLYSQLGLTEEVFKGTANEETMLNYYSHTVEPILCAIADEFTRKFITKTGRTQKRAVVFVRDPFKLVPVNNIAEIADKFTRNEILTSNEIRSIIGFAPSDQPNADELRNKNINAPKDGMNTMMEQPLDENGLPIESDNIEENQNESIQFGNAFKEMTKADFEKQLSNLDTMQKTIEDLYKKYSDVEQSDLDDGIAHSEYDPVYQHNYYMAHRVLKGRQSAAKKLLNTEGKENAKTYKEGVDEEKKSKIDSLRETKKANVKQIRSQMSYAREAHKDEVDKLSNDLTRQLARLADQYESELASTDNPEEKKQIRKAHKRQVEDLRNELKLAKRDLQDAYESSSENLKSSIEADVLAEGNNFNKEKYATMQEADEKYTGYVESLTKVQRYLKSYKK